MENFINIGFIKKTHGLKGDVKVQIEEKYLEDFLKTEVVFVLIKGKKVPYFSEDIRSGNDLLAKFEEVDSKEAAKELVNREIFLRDSDLLPDRERKLETEASLFYKKYEGFEIQDLEVGTIGTIKAVVEFPQQEMAVVFYKEKETLIPLHENLIEKIDETSQTILMNLPEGLLEL